MDTMRLVGVLAGAGVLGTGMPDAVRRMQAQCGEAEPTSADLETLRTAAPHLFTPSAPPAEVTLSAEERLSRARRGTGPNKFKLPPVEDPQQQQAFAAMPPTARLTAYRLSLAERKAHG